MAFLNSPLDRKLWAIGPISFAIVGIVFFVLSHAGFELLSGLQEATLISFLSSVSGATGSLLGLSLAALAILVAFRKSTKREVNEARIKISVAVLVLSAMLLALLISVNVVMITGVNPLASIVVLSLAVSSSISICVVGLAFTMAVATAG